MQQLIEANVRDIPDFPKKGIIFKDITPLLENADVFKKITDHLVSRYKDQKIDKVVGIESRGFIFGTPLAYLLGAGFVPVRKQGKLPYKTDSVVYDLEYGSATMEMHVDSIKKGERILLLDDLLATGGTAKAACQLIEQQGGNIVEISMVIELSFLKGREKLNGYNLYTLAKY